MRNSAVPCLAWQCFLIHSRGCSGECKLVVPTSVSFAGIGILVVQDFFT